MTTPSAGDWIEGHVGRYRIEGLLGHRGVGLMFKASSDAGERVTVKTALVIGDGWDSLRVERLRNEAEILSLISNGPWPSPNIPRFVDSNLPLTRQARSFLVTEPLDGARLIQLHRDNPMPETRACNHAITVLEILEHLHERARTIHRGIDAHNLIVNRTGRLMVPDFSSVTEGYRFAGLERRWDGHDLEAIPLGRLGWSAPEQFASGRVTKASDIYALGTVLFFLLTGKRPSEYMKPDGSLTVSPHVLRPFASEAMSQIVETATRPDPVTRFQTATDMKNAILSRQVHTEVY